MAMAVGRHQQAGGMNSKNGARALLIVNRKSRSGEEARAAIIERLRARGIETVEADCARREDLAQCIRDHAARVSMVVVAGGDGTLNAAAPGLVDTGLPLGLLPTGTANDLARTLGIPADLDAAADIIAAGHVRKINVGLVNDILFFNVASLGLSVELAHELTGDIKRRFGRLGYMLAALRVLSRARPFHATIATEKGSTRVLTLQIAVGNGRYYGGGNIVDEAAAIDAPRLDLYSLEFRNAWTFALLARDFHYGEHGAWREVRTDHGRAFKVTTRKPRSVNADGEILTRTPAQFSMREAAVTVFVPADRGAGEA
jgi:YegS/Rv2252/BmrU family lipid kinase